MIVLSTNCERNVTCYHYILDIKCLYCHYRQKYQLMAETVNGALVSFSSLAKFPHLTHSFSLVFQPGSLVRRGKYEA